MALQSHAEMFAAVETRPGEAARVPFPYQAALASDPWPETLAAPTGFGKTAAVLSAWAWKLSQGDPDTPRRLVACLPMRTLVEQVASDARRWRAALASHLGTEVSLHVAMGGAEDLVGVPDWIMHPERPAIVVGTQDILVSAVLMRGYSVSRYRWPVDFALLNNDALWVFDEVQLAGASLRTGAQMQGFRDALGGSAKTLWMSATLDPAWLATPDHPAPSRNTGLTDADLASPRGALLLAARKSLRRSSVEAMPTNAKSIKAYAAEVAQIASEGSGPGRRVIVFLNTVARARAVHAALAGSESQVVLLHSRFRAGDRAARTALALSDPPPQGRIVVTTQAIEAGVDISCDLMVTEIAPWASMVQRFGRCNRFAECPAGGEVAWIDLPDELAAPYRPEDISDARDRLAGMTECGIRTLSGMSPPPPPPVATVRRRDLLDLFDTEPDLTGHDTDISLYVRDANDTDCQAFWRPVEQRPAADAPSPTRVECCPVPIGGLRDLLRRGAHAWAFSATDGTWNAVGASGVRPGMIVWVDCESGGYTPDAGFDPLSKVEVEYRHERSPLPPVETMVQDPQVSVGRTVTLAAHTANVVREASAIANALGLTPPEAAALRDAALWHDVGKAHPGFQEMLGAAGDGVPLAKSGDVAGQPKGAGRKGFRHELASALCHAAHARGGEHDDLVGYLVCAHHGKVRTRIRPFPGEAGPRGGGAFARGVHQGDVIPAVALDGLSVPETVLDLTPMRVGGGEGRSWAARSESLLRKHGPFRLALLEAALRIADWRASAAEREGRA